jgi:DNA polymerase-3 subunit epsilon
MKHLWSHRRPQAGPSPFDLVDFAIVDLETTGWAPEEATITEIGAVLVCGGRVRAQFSSLVNPGSAIPEQVSDLTGINDAMVASAPPLATVLAGFLSFAQGCVLAAHNAPFDIAFLIAACKACDLPWPRFRVLDTVELAHRVLGEQEVADCKLATLADHFGARTKPRHRALPDALATADVLTALLRRLVATGVTTLDGAGCTEQDGDGAPPSPAAAEPAPAAAADEPRDGEPEPEQPPGEVTAGPLADGPQTGDLQAAP